MFRGRVGGIMRARRGGWKVAGERGAGRRWGWKKGRARGEPAGSVAARAVRRSGETIFSVGGRRACCEVRSGTLRSCSRKMPYVPVAGLALLLASCNVRVQLEMLGVGGRIRNEESTSMSHEVSLQIAHPRATRAARQREVHAGADGRSCRNDALGCVHGSPCCASGGHCLVQGKPACARGAKLGSVWALERGSSTCPNGHLLPASAIRLTRNTILAASRINYVWPAREIP